jgi:hypothetical protein
MNRIVKKELSKRGLKFRGKNKFWFQNANDIIGKQHGEKI